MSKQEKHQIEVEDKQCQRAKWLTVAVLAGWVVLTVVCYLMG